MRSRDERVQWVHWDALWDWEREVFQSNQSQGRWASWREKNLKKEIKLKTCENERWNCERKRKWKVRGKNKEYILSKCLRKMRSYFLRWTRELQGKSTNSVKQKRKINKKKSNMSTFISWDSKKCVFVECEPGHLSTEGEPHTRKMQSNCWISSLPTNRKISQKHFLNSFLNPDFSLSHSYQERGFFQLTFRKKCIWKEKRIKLNNQFRSISQIYYPADHMSIAYV